MNIKLIKINQIQQNDENINGIHKRFLALKSRFWVWVGNANTISI